MSLLYSIFVVVLIGVFFWRRRSPAKNLPYPPGPPTSLISGNARNMPTRQPWLTYTRWAKQYGSVFHIRVYSQHIIVINSLKDAIALLEKRSQIYSDRPMMPMVEHMGWDFNAGLLPYGDKWRRHRKLFQQNFKREVAATYRPVQTSKIHEMLQKLLFTPEDFVLHYKTVAAAIVMAAMYDNHISSANVDRFVNIAEQAILRLSEAMVPGAMLVNAFPWLRYLPSWFPGTGFRQVAEGCKVYTDQMLNVPFSLVKEKMASGAETSSLTARLLRRSNRQGVSTEVEDDIRSITATALAAGVDTTVSALGTFFYAMLAHPDAQKKAQEELDTVVGTHRLPDYNDRSCLPFIEAVYREVMRWRPVTPLAVPHATSEEDIYDGYYIPKGSIIIPNIWAMAHDESVYTRPDLFLPERFIGLDGELIDGEFILGFGFGRRICPGRHMASSTVWLTIATVLSTFNIIKAKDADGNDIPVNDDYLDGALMRKVPFRCSITPRSPESRDLILKVNATYRET